MGQLLPLGRLGLMRQLARMDRSDLLDRSAQRDLMARLRLLGRLDRTDLMVPMDRLSPSRQSALKDPKARLDP